MKHTIFKLAGISLLALAFTCTSRTVLGQASVQTIPTDQGNVQTTTTSDGTISEFSPDTIVVKTENAAEPVHYTYSKSTTYVDDAGNPVSIDTVKSGLPVTVYYVKDGDNLMVSKVIVRKNVITPTTSIQDSKTTTTTTTDK